MTNARRMADRVSELIDQRRRFVQATVVRAQCPTSARPGDCAVVFDDGAIEGFVGGQCAEGSVRIAALDVLANGEATLLRILPEDGESFPDGEGAITVVNPCLSGGALEIYLEPKLPAPGLLIVGQTPIAAALSDFGQPLGFDIMTDAGPLSAARATAVIIASHGRNETESIRAGLDAGVGFIGLVASAKRGAAVLEELDLSAEELRRVHSPVGVAIGARTAEEIALSILADLVKAIRLDGLTPPDHDETSASFPSEAIDPVCGMTVIVDDETPHLHRGGVDHWFCNPGCRTRYAEDLTGDSL